MKERSDILFGTSVFGGFKRKNVIDYIDRLQRELSHSSDDPQEMQALTEALERSQAEQTMLAERLEQLQRNTEPMEEELRALREEVTGLKAQLLVERAANEMLAEQMVAGSQLSDEAPSEASAKAASETTGCDVFADYGEYADSTGTQSFAFH